MKFYLDFEANQYTNHIISVGCMAENGETFYSLVQTTPKEKITKFITNLTGITTEMIRNAPTADEVFKDMMFWAYRQSETASFYCYGDADKNYIEATSEHMKSNLARLFLVSLKYSIVNCMPVVAKAVGRETVGLKNVYNFINNKIEEQKHDALEDAMMLKYVIDHLDVLKPEDGINIPNSIKNKNYPKSTKRAPELYISWADGTKHKWKANTLANKGNYKIKCSTENEAHTKYFNSLETAALWMLKYNVRLSPKEPENVEKMIKKIKHAINTKKRYCLMDWSER